MAKSAVIRAEFAPGGIDKRVRIYLAEGFRFVRYPVLSIQYSDREVLADSELQIVLDSVTSKPVRQTHYATINSGYLEYKLTDMTNRVEIKNISFTVDELVYYGRTDMLQDAIRVESIVDGVVTNAMSVDILQNNTLVPYTMALVVDTSWNDNKINMLLSGDQSEAWNVRLRKNSINSLTQHYLKSLKVYYSYPKELTVVGGNPANYTVDTANGIITFTQTHTGNSTFNHFPTLLASGVLPGVYT
jgi:hypothetical protein